MAGIPAPSCHSLEGPPAKGPYPGQVRLTSHFLLGRMFGLTHSFIPVADPTAWANEKILVSGTGWVQILAQPVPRCVWQVLFLFTIIW